MTLDERTEFRQDADEPEPDEGAPQCDACGSFDVDVEEIEYQTGVTSPDGGREVWSGLFMACRSCGERWDD